jgi:predicted methyltransferase
MLADHRRRRIVTRGALTALILALSAMSSAAAWSQSLDTATSAAIDTALAGAHRSDKNKARDQYRHPRQTLAFFGLRNDMTVVEIWPGGGWYSEILAPVLRAKGKLYAAQYGSSGFQYQRNEDAALLEKKQRYPDVFGAVQFATLWSPGELVIAPPGSADLVVTFRNVHNWVNPEYKQDPAKLFGAFFAALKPGGILGVEDHRWPDPRTEDPSATEGYVSEDRVIKLAKAAGFELVGRSDVNRNPKDNHMHPNGVWSLLPDLSLKEGEDRETYVDIGESDRMTLKFRKPTGK